MYASYDQYPTELDLQNREYYQEQPNPLMQRGTTMYSTLPCRKTPKIYQEEPQTYRRYSPQPSNYYQGNISDSYGYSSLPRRQIEPIYPQHISPNQIGLPNIQNQVPSLRERQLNFESSTPNKQQSNFSKIPMGISNFFSPIRRHQPTNQELQNSLKISPIEPCHSGRFQSSTPQKPINAAINLSNALLSPKKSTMSNEELYAVIHRSKKKLNIKTDTNETNTSTTPIKSEPKQIETGYLGKPQTRNSWAPNNPELNKNYDLNNIGSRQSWACNDRLGVKKGTSPLDFKKLLLQQNSKTPAIPTKKISAVEQLKLTKDNIPSKKLPQSPMQIADLSASPKSFGKKFITPTDLPTSPEKRPQKIMSPRTTWRFANPRSDVLSSTILEDCREDETSNSSNERNSYKEIHFSGKISHSNEHLSPKFSNVTTFREGIAPIQNTVANRYNFNTANERNYPKLSNNFQSSDRNSPRSVQHGQNIQSNMSGRIGTLPNGQNIQNSIVNSISDTHSPKLQAYGQNFQSSIPKNNIASDGSNGSFVPSKNELSRSQYIQARREAFLNIPSNGQSKGSDSPPTLETAL